MDTNLTQVLVEIVRDVKNTVESQWPEVAQQALAYDMTAAWVVLGLASLPLITAIFVMRWALRRDCFSNSGNIPEFFTFFIAAIIAFACCVPIPPNVLKIIKINTAPKLYLIDRFTNR